MKKKILVGIPVLLVLFIAGFVIWGLTPQKAHAEALEGLQNSELVQVENLNGLMVFTPLKEISSTGVIFYPGGHVDARAYSHLLHQIAADGYTVVLVPMPLNLAVLGSQKAESIPAQFPEIESWVIAGHSVGGAMAAHFTIGHQEMMDGLILWGSYPAESTDLTGYQGAVFSLYGSKDGISSVAEVEDSRQRMPEDAIFDRIEGGNHAQFGSYGWQKGDLPATISIEEQQKIIVKRTLNFLHSITK